MHINGTVTRKRSVEMNSIKKQTISIKLTINHEDGCIDIPQYIHITIY